ncbi:MAG: acyl carrier protein [Hyphomicrobiaceae bacterium]
MNQIGTKHQGYDMQDTTGIVKKPVTTGGTIVRPEIREIFAYVFQYGEDLYLHTSREDVERWDSLQHVALVAAVESTFGISLSMDEMMEIASVSDIHTILDRHGA